MEQIYIYIYIIIHHHYHYQILVSQLNGIGYMDPSFHSPRFKVVVSVYLHIFKSFLGLHPFL